MSKQAFYNGILYQIEYQPELSNSDYTQHKVYHIKTGEENHCKSVKAIVSVMEEKLGYKQKGHCKSVKAIVSVMEEKLGYKQKDTQCPYITNALHPYYELTYND